MLNRVKKPTHVQVPALVMEATEIMQVHPNTVTTDQAFKACEEGTITFEQYEALSSFIDTRTAH
jgi:hypothetical protein